MDKIRSVQFTKEFERIASLPRRAPGILPDSYPEALSALLRRPGGSQTLRPIQAWALAEMWGHRGLLGLIRVGHGKTLVSLLAPVMLRAVRPVLLLPAKLVGKTERESRILSQHWRIPNHIRIMSYEELGRVQRATVLEGYRPDLIIADECHRLKNRKAAVTRRIARCFADRPETVFVGLTGTVTNKSLKEYHHLAAWSLKPAGVPMPNTWGELEDWADTLDEDFKGERPMPGPLASFCDNRERAVMGDTAELRRGFYRRLTETGGVVASQDSRIAASLEINAIRLPDRPLVIEAFGPLRKDWERPDGERLIDGSEVWRVARELALGFYYRWDPAPPAAWREARREWAATCRQILSDNRLHLDSELAVKQALRAGHYPSALGVLRVWESIRPSFDPNSVPVWFDDTAVDLAAEWAAKHRGIVWTEHRGFAKRLAKRACLSYYGSKGEDANDRLIESHDPRVSLVASTEANAEGRNLQFMCESLETSPHPNASKWEQKIGRTHRDGQLSDVVSVDVFMGCAEHVDAWDRALGRARYTLDTTGQEQKILYADTNMSVPGAFDPVWDKDFYK